MAERPYTDSSTAGWPAGRPSSPSRPAARGAAAAEAAGLDGLAGDRDQQHQVLQGRRSSGGRRSRCQRARPGSARGSGQPQLAARLRSCARAPTRVVVCSSMASRTCRRAAPAPGSQPGRSRVLGRQPQGGPGRWRTPWHRRPGPFRTTPPPPQPRRSVNRRADAGPGRSAGYGGYGTGSLAGRDGHLARPGLPAATEAWYLAILRLGVLRPGQPLLDLASGVREEVQGRKG